MPKTRINLEKTENELLRAIARGDYDQIAGIFAPLDPADMEDLFSKLDDDQQLIALEHLPSFESADIIEELNDELAAELISQLGDQEVVRIVDEMDPDKAVDLLGDLEPNRQENLLKELEDEEELRPLLIHADDSAGGLMTTDFVALRRRMTASEAMQAMRDWSPEGDDFYFIYVVDAHGALKGVLDLRRLIIASPDAQLSEIMNPDVYTISAEADQEEAAMLMARYDLVALPVANQAQQLLGVITIDDVIDVLEEEAVEDFVHLGGAEPLQLPYLDAGIFKIAGKRIGWLLLLFVTATFTGSVMRLFEGELQAMAVLAIFIPLIIGTGGNAGSQTTATIISALSRRDIDWNDALRVWLREIQVGLLLGTGMAIAAFARAITWEANGRLGVTVACAVLGIVLWSTSIASVMPLAAYRLGIDPTNVSGPVMSTLVDATGLLIYFSLARLFLGL